jgi:hypothetical protein
VLLSAGTSFTAAVWATGETPATGWQRLVGDFNNDGRDDVASFHNGLAIWDVLLAQAGSFGRATWVDFGEHEAEMAGDARGGDDEEAWAGHLVGDFDGDSLDDLGSLRQMTGAWWVSRSAGWAPGNDTLLGVGGNDLLIGEEGNDMLDGGSGNDTLEGGSGADWLLGREGGDDLRGGGGDDRLTGAQGDDQLGGGRGTDLLSEVGDGTAVLRNTSLAFGALGTDVVEDVERASLLGGNGADLLDATGFAGTVTLGGGAGNDTLLGAAGRDLLQGGAGTDLLSGGGGNDSLWGEAGSDTLYGDGGNDWLDAGSAAESADGGDGLDFNAFVTVVGGALYSDVQQGNSGSCWVVASLASAVHSGQNLGGRIVYLGNGVYRVSWLAADQTGAWYQDVSFQGDRLGADANPAAEGESWVLLYQRAILQQFGIPWGNPPAGNPGGVLPLLTGRSIQWYWPHDLQGMLDALAAGRAVTAATWDLPSQLATSQLVTDHYYAVAAIFQVDDDGPWLVRLYNPWGHLVIVTWEQFAVSMEAVAIS